MNDAIKVFVVRCGSCSSKQVWHSSLKYKVCGECNSAVVLRTASPDELKYVKAQVGAAPLMFSNYLVYSLSPEDVEEAVVLKKARQQKMKEDVAERKQYAQLEKTNFNFNGRLKLLNDGNGKRAKKRKR